MTDQDIATFLRRVGEGDIEAVRAMLAATPELVNAIGPHPYWGGRPQALHVSIETRRREMFDLLLAAGADVNGTNEQYDHWSPLMLTIHWDHPDMRRALLARQARVGLIEAMLLEDDVRVEALLRPGRSALPEIEPNSGSILAFARTPFAIDRLLELGAARDTRDRWGATPIEALSRLGPRGEPLVRHLSLRGVEAGPSEYARLGDQSALVALIESRPDVVRSDDVLMGAVDFGHHDLVRWLLERGANVNARSRTASRHTALHSAAWNGDMTMAELLVAAGADVTARDDEHHNTPGGWARVAVGVTNNSRCQDVADYLVGLEGRAASDRTGKLD